MLQQFHIYTKRTESRDSSRYLNTTVHYVQDVLGINSNQKEEKNWECPTSR